MSRPSGSDVTEFSYQRIWESVVVGGVPERLNTRAEFVSYLKSKGHVQMIAEEFAERNIGFMLNNIQTVCEQWDALGIPRPLEVTDQNGSMITWKHPRFEEISGRKRLPENFCDVWQWVKDCREREFLFCCASYLHLLGCSRIYITDTSGDGGIDLIGIYEHEPFRGICFLVQAKTALSEVGKESLFSDYTKFLLLRRNAKWNEYEKALGIDKTSDGVGIVYIFASNREFNPAIVQAARDLPIMLRSGRQIAHALSKRADLNRWMFVRDHVGATGASLSRNLVVPLREAL
jgi:Restriction endonuclease